MAAERSILLAELTREDSRRLAPTALAVLPVGATEQHGPHLPVGTDFMHAEWVTRAAAAQVAGQIPIVVAPTLPFGCSPHHLQFGGTISLSTETYHRALSEMAESLITGGYRRLFIVNGHGGNHDLIQLVARDLALKHPVQVGAGSWWHIAWDVLVAERAHEVGRVPGHAGVFETSLVLAMRPELVQEPRPHREAPGSTSARGFWGLYRAERSGFWKSIDGYTDSPDLGDADRGRLYLDVSARELARVLLEFYESTGPPAA